MQLAHILDGQQGKVTDMQLSNTRTVSNDRAWKAML